MSLKQQPPPGDGTLNVLPGFLDFHAEINPSLPSYSFPSREKPEVITHISYAELAQATHRLAHALRPGRLGNDGEVVAALVHCDALLYNALFIGSARAGITLFPMSPRNSAEAVYFMLEKTACHRIITNGPLAPLVAAVRSICDSKNYPINVDNIPTLNEIFPSLGQVSEVLPYPTAPKQGLPDEVVLYLHSSGSTGFPKPIPQTNKTLLQWAQVDHLMDARYNGIRWGTGNLPTFHTLGVFLQLLLALMSSEPVALFTPREPEPPVIPTPQNLLEMARLTGATALAVVPAFIEEWAHSDTDIKYLATLRSLAFSGGPLSEKNSKKLTDAGVRLHSTYGGTEFGAHARSAAISSPGTSWEWLRFSSKVKCRWIPQADGTYELHFLTCETHQPAVENLPDVKGYATSDLFEPHPTEEGLWRIVGRTDDVIVLGSGEKIVPIPQEGLLSAVPFVAGVVMFGRERTQPGVLIEPSAAYAVNLGDDTGLVKFRDKIWPWVEQANQLAPSFSRIFKEMIIVANPTKPLPRAGKGTVQRKQALVVYAKEIDDLYETVQQSADANGIPPPDSWSREHVELWLSEHAKSLTATKSQDIPPSADLFELGFDSLSATYLRNRIIGALRSSSDSSAQSAAPHVPQDFIFSHPTLQRLAAAVVRLVNPDSSSEQLKEDGPYIEKMIAKYSSDLPAFKKVERPSGSDVVVLLTGSTGNLGSHILASLLAEKRVAKVFTLNRSSPRSDRQRDAFVDSGLPVDLLDSKSLTAVVGDIFRPDLGLDPDTLAEIKNSVTHIIHNAWKLDFNLSLSSFESYVASTRNLVDLSSQCANPAKFLFTSSISSAQQWDTSKGPVPEQVLPDAEVAVGWGYGGSKYVVERLLANAAEKGLGTTSFRIGQICGSPPAGAWNITDWVPIIVKSSQALGCLPSLDGDVAWITMDTAAHTITDVVLSTTGRPDPLLINLVQPYPVPWNDIFAAISSTLPRQLPLIPFSDWLAKVESSSDESNPSKLNEVPAVKLLKFLRGISAPSSKQPFFETAIGQSVSPALKSASVVDAQMVQSWVGYWQRKRFIE